MVPSSDVAAVLAEDWLGLCRRAAEGVREVLATYSTVEARGEKTGRGRGGDEALVIDRAAEDVVFRELDALGAPVTAVSEERGHVEIAGGGAAHVVIDPIDGSLNAKRGLPAYGLSIAVSSGPSMADVELGYVADLHCGEEWWARRGEGAYFGHERLPTLADGGRLELLGVDSATPRLVASAAEALRATGAHRLRALGTIALHLSSVAGGRLDAMLSLAPSRSVDAAAGQLIVREAGGAAAFPDTADGALGATLDLDMRSRVVAARDETMLEQVVAALPR
jgi:myo-inositol-1(or 4)-monophosphatase